MEASHGIYHLGLIVLRTCILFDYRANGKTHVFQRILAGIMYNFDGRTVGCGGKSYVVFLF